MAMTPVSITLNREPDPAEPGGNPMTDQLTPSARRMMLALEHDELEAVSLSELTVRLRPMNPNVLPDVAAQLAERGWVEIAGVGPTRWIRLTSAGLNALAWKTVML